MPDIVNDDDLSALAAEYVLGTLEADERTRANVLLDVDHGFRGLVRVWERRFGELHLMVEPVEPDAKVWLRIKGKLADPPPPVALVRTEPAPVVAPPPIVAPVAAPVVAPVTAPAAEAETKSEAKPETQPETTSETKPDTDAVANAEQKLADLINEVEKFAEKRPPDQPPDDTVVEAPPTQPEPAEEAREPERILRGPAPLLRGPDETRLEPVGRERRPRVGRWRAATLLMALIAIGLGGLIAVWRYAPDRLPAQLRPMAVLNLPGLPPPPPEKKPAQHGTVFEE